MPARRTAVPPDFRTLPYSPKDVIVSGRFLGGRVYWRIHWIENFFRVVVHSILSVQIGPDWWAIGAGQKLRDEVAKKQERFARRMSLTAPGKHEIYFTVLFELVEIIRANADLIEEVIPEIDDWIVRLETIRPSRNLVGHVNWPSEADRSGIEEVYRESRRLERQLVRDRFALEIP